eukprot:1368672-Amphidinium_carterae.1
MTFSRKHIHDASQAVQSVTFGNCSQRGVGTPHISAPHRDVWLSTLSPQSGILVINGEHFANLNSGCSVTLAKGTPGDRRHGWRRKYGDRHRPSPRLAPLTENAGECEDVADPAVPVLTHANVFSAAASSATNLTSSSSHESDESTTAILAMATSWCASSCVQPRVCTLTLGLDRRTCALVACNS